MLRFKVTLENTPTDMASDTITFQLGMQYLSRTALRVEQLLNTVTSAQSETNQVAHRAALNALYELNKITAKPELKGRFLQELMRIEHALHKSALSLPQSVIEDLSEEIQALSEFAGQFGGAAHHDAFLNAITFASMSHSNEADLYFAPLYFWLEGPVRTRQDDLAKWLKEFHSLELATHIYLTILRRTGNFESITPEAGFYQYHLPKHHKTCQLILVRLDKDSGLFPKMQVVHHGLSLRLCEAKTMQEVSDSNIQVQLSVCEL